MLGSNFDEIQLSRMHGKIVETHDSVFHGIDK